MSASPDQRDQQQEAIACRLDPAALDVRRKTLSEVAGTAQEARELPDGYALRFPGHHAQAAQLLEVIAAERECCPFFRFDLSFEAHSGPIWLSIRGPEGTKELLRDLVPAAGVLQPGPPTP